MPEVAEASLPVAVMQGRLSAPLPGHFQSFPVGTWEREMETAAQLGLDAVEWVHDVVGAGHDPLGDDATVSLLVDAVARTGTAVRSVCADWFMVHRLVGETSSEAAAHLEALLARCATVGISRVVLPFVDASSLCTPEEQDEAVAVLTVTAASARRHGVELHLETDLAPAGFAALLARLPVDVVRVNYDIGNSAGLGFDPVEELAAYGDRLGSVHVKDRVRGGGTVPLGCGDADVPRVFALLRARGWVGPVVLQVAREGVGDEAATVARQLATVRAWWSAAAAG